MTNLSLHEIDTVAGFIQSASALTEVINDLSNVSPRIRSAAALVEAQAQAAVGSQFRRTTVELLAALGVMVDEDVEELDDSKLLMLAHTTLMKERGVFALPATVEFSAEDSQGETGIDPFGEVSNLVALDFTEETEESEDSQVLHSLGESVASVFDEPADDVAQDLESDQEVAQAVEPVAQEQVAETQAAPEQEEVQQQVEEVTEQKEEEQVVAQEVGTVDSAISTIQPLIKVKEDTDPNEIFNVFKPQVEESEVPANDGPDTEPVSTPVAPVANVAQIFPGLSI